MNRRDFLKACAVAAPAAALSSCKRGYSEDEDERGEMTFRTDPLTGEKVSILGYGCMRWPTAEEGDAHEPDQEAVNRLVDRAIMDGITYFDTAPVYSGGLSEAVTGEALARHPREKWTIATKLSNFRKESWGREESLGIYNDSFRKLQVDTIDYYLLHAAGMGGREAFDARFVDNGMLDFLLSEREKGRIGHLGLSFHGDRAAFDHILGLHGKYRWDFIQIQMNYLDWNHAGRNDPGTCNASYQYEKLAALGIPVIVMEPLLGGQLAKLPRRYEQMLAQRNPGGSTASWAFRFCGTFPQVLTVLSGMTYMEHLEDNLSTFSPLEPLSEEEMELLEDIAHNLALYPTLPCTGCRYCMPCPYGIDIPALMVNYNRCVEEGMIATDAADPEYARLRRRYLSEYDRTVDPSRQADKCIGCGQCTPKCPQGIDIPFSLRKLDAITEQLRRGSSCPDAMARP